MPGNFSLPPDDWLGIIFRLLLALAVGGVIGVDRQLSHKPAGLRTHMLVSFGSALFVLVPLQIDAGQHANDSFTRAIQGIATGVGFLGGGEILRSPRPGTGQEEIQGLTSAAAIWVSAALGMAAGCGLWQTALVGAVLSLFILRVLKKLERFD